MCVWGGGVLLYHRAPRRVSKYHELYLYLLSPVDSLYNYGYIQIDQQKRLNCNIPEISIDLNKKTFRSRTKRQGIFDALLSVKKPMRVTSG